jgi:hypothetical protein
MRKAGGASGPAAVLAFVGFKFPVTRGISPG